MEAIGGTSEGRCLVCSDRSSGRHYGVASCEGCKSFFKRCIRKKSSFVCKHGGVCEIDQARRNRCQSCRLKRCFHVGMRQEAVQEGYTQRIGSSRNLVANQTKLLENLQALEQLLTFEIIEGGDSRQVLAFHVLHSAVRWCRKVTSLMGLTLYDSRVLIGRTWSYVFVVTLIQSRYPFVLDGPVRLQNDINVFALMERLRSLCTSSIDAMFLRTLLLLNPDVAVLTNPVQVEAAQNKALRLVEEVDSYYYAPNQGPSLTCRISKLLLIMLGTSHCTSQILERNFFPTVHQSVETYVKDFLDKQR